MAKDRLASKHPHITWLCPDLHTAMSMDDRARFHELCEEHAVPVPEAGLLVSRDDIAPLARKFSRGIVVKRLESSVNRSEEIVFVNRGATVPNHVRPSSTDQWQWQRFIRGSEYSVWYVCNNGNVTFSACYHSAPDLVHFDPAETPEQLDTALRRMISRLRLTGQYAFDFIMDDEDGKPHVIECNPRASSILETVSSTPLWAEAFFGVDVSKRSVFRKIGFLYHRNCWPWAPRAEGIFEWTDPLPFLAAELAWPLNALANHAFSENGYQFLDVNIGKIIVPGASPQRGLQSFRDTLAKQRLSVAKTAVKHIDTLLLDGSAPGGLELARCCSSDGHKVTTFSFGCKPEDAEFTESPSSFAVEHILNSRKEFEEFVESHTSGETRLVAAGALSRELGVSSPISYRYVDPSGSSTVTRDIPLRKLRVLHLVGSFGSSYYAELSKMRAVDSNKTLASSGRFDSFFAYVHISGEWSVEAHGDFKNLEENAPRLSPGEALAKIDAMQIDVGLSHMFDYDGMISYRGLLKVLGIPLVGVPTESLTLSINKARTKACAELEGVRVPRSTLIRRGDKIEMDPPFILKPVEEDNSLGLRLVTEESQIPEAVHEAFQFGETVMCEQYIELGRELRAAVIEDCKGNLQLLPTLEYMLPADSPIRTEANKHIHSSDGKIILRQMETACPAKVDDTLRQKIYNACANAHRALGCRDYSLYDFRIDPRGEPFLLEANLFCSFGKKSVIVMMYEAAGKQGTDLFAQLAERAIVRNKAQRAPTDTFDMKA